MKSCVLSIVALVLSASSFAQSMESRKIEETGMTVYTDANFRGRSATLRGPVTDLKSMGMNDSISSIRVAPGERWEICEHANFQGRCAVVSDIETDLKQASWNDMISSARPVRGSGGGWSPYPPQRTYIVLFDQRNYRGNPVEYSSSQGELGRFNDRAQSVTISRGRWELCEHINFGGRCVVLDRNTPDLSVTGLFGRVSSIRPVSSGGDWNRPPPAPARDYVVLYDQLNYRGSTVTYDSGQGNVGSFNDRAQSVTIGRGAWELCEHANFGGRCVVLNENSPDLGRQGLLRRVSSVRPAARPR